MNTCRQCGDAILEKRNSRKFCGRSCAARFNNNGVRRHGKPNSKCLNCGEETSSSRNKYCSQQCQKDFEYKGYIDRWMAGEEGGVRSSKFCISNHIRRYMFEKNSSSCQECGWSEMSRFTNLIPLQIHHKDGDYTNNREDNLSLLCPNCHSLTETFGSKNTNGRRRNGHF